jgi:hypothetical protein
MSHDDIDPGATDGRPGASAAGMPPPEVPDPPVTGDGDVDAALSRLHASATTGDLDAQAEAGETVHRALQDRLADLGGG